MSKKLKKVVIVLAVIAVVFVVAFFSARYYAYHGGKRDVQSEQAAFTMKTKDILAAFTTNEAEANKKYLENQLQYLV